MMRDVSLESADCTLTSLNFSNNASTDVPKSPESENGASRKRFFSFLPMSTRFNYSWLSVATTAPSPGRWQQQFSWQHGDRDL